MRTVKAIFFVAMILLGIVSIYTTYRSLYESILPEPTIRIDFGGGITHNCSIFALMLSIAIGMMLFALKIAIIDEHKRLNIIGVIGLAVVGSISIAFNLDVLYRTADRSFFINYSTSQVKGPYEDYLTQAKAALLKKKDELGKVVAKQEGELDAEIKGLRKAPAGYGPIAKEEDYQLTLLAKTSAVELETVQGALAKEDEANQLLRSSMPKSIEEIEQLQHELRVAVKDLAAVSGVPLPEVVKLESPLFAVFSRVFNWNTIGVKEVFFIILAFLLDLADIIGYSLVPNKPKRSSKRDLLGRTIYDDDDVLVPLPLRPVAEAVACESRLELTDESAPAADDATAEAESLPAAAAGGIAEDPPPERRRSRPFGIGRR